MSENIYAQLCARFKETQKLRKGNTDLDYLTTEQVVTRLNDVLGHDGWSFEIREHGADAKGIWVLGRLTCFRGTIGPPPIIREQFGECQTNPGMADGDARKGAASDALKKAASLIGVGLYLAHKEEAAEMAARAAPSPRTPTAPTRSENGSQAQHGAAQPATEPPDDDAEYTPLTEDQLTQLFDLIKERTGSPPSEVSLVLGSPLNKFLDMQRWTGREFLLRWRAWKKDGTPIPGAPPAMQRALAAAGY